MGVKTLVKGGAEEYEGVTPPFYTPFLTYIPIILFYPSTVPLPSRGSVFRGGREEMVKK